MEDFVIEDVLKKTKGILSGKINHNRLKDWFLDFSISSDNLLAINTTAEDNDIYYGIGMFNGNANFYGQVQQIIILKSPFQLNMMMV